MTGRWCWVKLERRGESWGDGLLKGDLSISVFFTGDEMPVWGRTRGLQGCRQVGPFLGPQPPYQIPCPSFFQQPMGKGLRVRFIDGAN